MESQPTAHDRDLIGLEGMPAEVIQDLLDTASAFESGFRGDELSGRLVANLFFENSTRTRCSFEVAASRLGARSINLGASGSSVAKGESELDTAVQLDAMGVDAIVVRSSVNGMPARMAERCTAPIVNAGDGRHEHPSQALLDLLTIRSRLERLAGLRVAIVGDIANSRVARSNVYGLEAMGAHVVLVGPPGMVDESFAGLGPAGRTTVSHDLDSIIPEVDVVMMLRIQRERGATCPIPPDYRVSYGMTVERAEALRPDQWLMHPGPVNQGVEIDPEVLRSFPRSLIEAQVSNGVLMRSAILLRAIASS